MAGVVDIADGSRNSDGSDGSQGANRSAGLPDPVETWRQVIVLLIEAADRGYGQPEATWMTRLLALGADSLASGAIALLPPDQDHELDAVALDPDVASKGVAELIGAAEHLTRVCPIEQFPAGASGVIVGLGDLIAETRA